MSNTTSIFALTPTEKATLRKQGVRLKDTGSFSAAELSEMLSVPISRGREIRALYEFQTVPSVGIRFAEDLVVMGYYSLADLAGKEGTELVHELELAKGYWQDPCVEDQCRLVVDFARTGDLTKRWWHFTEARKAYRAKAGYPADRPKKAWHETLNLYSKKAAIR